MPPPAEGLASRLVLGPALRAQPDRRLVALVREGYAAAFEEIVRRYGRALGRYAASIVGGRSEDVLQDAFSKALPALQRSDAEIDLRPWLFRIVRNTALNELRDSPPSAAALAEAIGGGRDPAEEAERREELADLLGRLQALPPQQRAAIVLRELEGLGHEEIAAALGLSGGGAARQAIFRARQALRDGAGLLVPPTLLKALLVGTGPGAEGAAAAGAVGALGAGGGAGAGIALKATAATVLIAGAVGAGVALDHPPRGREAEARVSQRESDRPIAGAVDPTEASGDENQLGEGSHGGPGHGRRGHGGGGEGRRGGPGGDHGPGHEEAAADDRGGRRAGEDRSGPDERGGDLDASGPGDGRSGGERQDRSGSDGGVRSGHGGPGSGDDSTSDSAGSGDGGPGSGSGSTGDVSSSSGPGSDGLGSGSASSGSGSSGDSGSSGSAALDSGDDGSSGPGSGELELESGDGGDLDGGEGLTQ